MDKQKFLTVLASLFLITGCSDHADKSKKEDKEEKKSSEVALNEEVSSPAALQDGKVKKEDVSYALGYNIGEVLFKTDDKLQTDEIMNGFKDAFKSTPTPRFKDEEIKNILMMYNMEISNSMKEKQEKARLDNIEKGKAFTAEYEKSSGVKKDPRGFWYRVVKEGKGAHPKEHDIVSAEYVGKKIDGKVFFNTREKGEGKTVDFSLDHLIKGLVMAIQEMPVGATWEIVLPSELAYGDNGAPDAILPGETLMFEIHLVDIKKKEEPKTMSSEKHEEEVSELEDFDQNQ